MRQAYSIPRYVDTTNDASAALVQSFIHIHLSSSSEDQSPCSFDVGKRNVPKVLRRVKAKGTVTTSRHLPVIANRREEKTLKKH